MNGSMKSLGKRSAVDVVATILAADMEHSLNPIPEEELISNYLNACEWRDALIKTGYAQGEPMDSVLHLIAVCLTEDERRRNNR